MPTVNTLLKILVIDDDAIVRSTISLMVTRAFPVAQITLCCTLEEGIQALDSGIFDIIVLDINLGKSNGLVILRKCISEKTSMPVLVMSSSKEEDVALNAFKAGAKGYICKDQIADGSHFAEALQLLLAGKTYIGSNIADRLILDLTAAKNLALSEQENKVLISIGSGLAVKEIASQMDISEKTVRTYRLRLLEKLNLSTDNEIVRYTIQNGLVA